MSGPGWSVTMYSVPADFSPSLLLRLAGSYSIKIETRDQPDTRVHRTRIWIVVDETNGAVFVRSVRGEKGNWYQRLQANPTADIIVGDEDVPVHATNVGADENALVSELLKRKYPADQHLFAILRPEVVAATLRLEPDVRQR